MTAYARGEDRNRMLRSGCQIHIRNPVSSNKLAAHLADTAGQGYRCHP